MKIAFGSDPAGLKCKEDVTKLIASAGPEVVEFGNALHNDLDFLRLAAAE